MKFVNRVLFSRKHCKCAQSYRYAAKKSQQVLPNDNEINRFNNIVKSYNI